jgi:hypothetical protein
MKRVTMSVKFYITKSLIVNDDEVDSSREEFLKWYECADDSELLEYSNLGDAELSDITIHKVEEY